MCVCSYNIGQLYYITRSTYWVSTCTFVVAGSTGHLTLNLLPLSAILHYKLYTSVHRFLIKNKLREDYKLKFIPTSTKFFMTSLSIPPLDQPHHNSLK